MFVELEGLRGATDADAVRRRKDLVDQVTIELVRHSVAEEAEVYPLVHDRIDAAEADQAKHEHADAEETMKRLDGLDADDPQFALELATLMTEIREHVAEEEGEMFPRLRATFTEQELLDLGAKVESVKKLALTGPHPSAPDAPPGDKLLGPVTGMFDRLRDSVTHRGVTD